MSQLSDYLRLVKGQQELSVRDISARAVKAGHALAPSRVTVYTRANHPEPTAQTLEALAAGFGVPVGRLQKFAGAVDHGEFAVDKSARRLTQVQRKAVNEIIRLLADGNKSAGEVEPADVADLSTRRASKSASVDAAAHPPLDTAESRERKAGRTRGEETQEPPWDE